MVASTSADRATSRGGFTSTSAARDPPSLGASSRMGGGCGRWRRSRQAAGSARAHGSGARHWRACAAVASTACAVGALRPATCSPGSDGLHCASCDAARGLRGGSVAETILQEGGGVAQRAATAVDCGGGGGEAALVVTATHGAAQGVVGEDGAAVAAGGHAGSGVAVATRAAAAAAAAEAVAAAAAAAAAGGEEVGLGVVVEADGGGDAPRQAARDRRSPGKPHACGIGAGQNGVRLLFLGSSHGG
jgi:hypothetical protein